MVIHLLLELGVAYDEQLVARVDDALAGASGIVRKRMFGVVCYMRRGHAFAGAWDNSLILRVGADAYDAALRESFVREFDITGKPMRGWVVVGPKGITFDEDLQDWLDRAMQFAMTLPKKAPKPPRPPRRSKRRE